MKSLIALTILLAPLSAMAEVPNALQPGAAYVMIPTAEDGKGRVLVFIPQSDGTVGGPVLSAEGDLLCNEGWSAKAEGGGTELYFTDIRLAANSCADGLEHLAAHLGQVSSELASDAGISLLNSAGKELFRLTSGG